MYRIKRVLFVLGVLLIAAGYYSLGETPDRQNFQEVVQLAWWGIWMVVAGGSMCFVSMFIHH